MWRTITRWTVVSSIAIIFVFAGIMLERASTWVPGKAEFLADGVAGCQTWVGREYSTHREYTIWCKDQAVMEDNDAFEKILYWGP